MKKIEEKIKTLITKENYWNPIKDRYWIDTITHVVYFNLNNKDLKELFLDYVDIENNESCNFFAEYQSDNHKIIYCLEFEDDTIYVSEIIDSIWLDYYVLKSANEY